MDRASIRRIREAGLEHKAIPALLKQSRAMIEAAHIGTDARPGGGLAALSAMAKTLDGGPAEVCGDIATNLRKLASVSSESDALEHCHRIAQELATSGAEAFNIAVELGHVEKRWWQFWK